MASDEDVISEYIEIIHHIKELEDKKRLLRDELSAQLHTASELPGRKWDFPEAVVEIVKGRTTQKLDRTKLVRQGVTAKILDSATVSNIGLPSLRITPKP
jgi:hypothetical protein